MDQEKCPACGGNYVYRQEGRVQGSFCEQCGTWGVVTTHTPAIVTDDMKYELRVSGGNYRNDAHIKAVAKITGKNFLMARALLHQENPLVLVDVATVVNEAIETLRKSGISYSTNPPFPYWNTENTADKV